MIGLRCGIHAMEYHSAIRKNEVMLFAATWMDLDIIILREESQRKTNIITHVEYKNNTF